MHFKIQVVIEEEFGQTTIEDIVQFEKEPEQVNSVGLSLLESKQLLQALQKTIVLHQADSYTAALKTVRVVTTSVQSKTIIPSNSEPYLESFRFLACASITVLVTTHRRNYSVY